jgi:hypothetical protein
MLEVTDVTRLYCHMLEVTNVTRLYCHMLKVTDVTRLYCQYAGGDRCNKTIFSYVQQGYIVTRQS